MYKLYYSPFSCSLAVHIALEKTEADFVLEKVEVRQGMHRSEDYLKLNKRGKVPLLQDGDHFVDQGAAILMYLAEKHPDAGLLPALDSNERAAAISSLFYMSNTVHPTLAMAFYPDRYSLGKPDDVLQRAVERTKDLLAEFEETLADHLFLDADQAYAADYYLATILNWLQMFQISLDPYPNLKAYKQRMGDLPEVGKASGKEMTEF